MVGSAVKEPTSVQVSWVASLSNGPSLWQMMLEMNSKFDKFRTDINDIKRNSKVLISWGDSNALACLVDGFLHKRGFSPLECGPRSSPTSTSFRKPPGFPQLILWNLCENTVCSIRFCAPFLHHCSSSDVNASRNEQEVLYSIPSDIIARAITRVTDDRERSIFKALFLLELNHTIDDELEDGYPFVIDVVGCIRTSRREVAF